MPEIGSVVQLAHPHHTLVVMLLLPPLTGHAVPVLPQIGPVVYLVLPRDPLLDFFWKKNYFSAHIKIRVQACTPPCSSLARCPSSSPAWPWTLLVVMLLLPSLPAVTDLISALVRLALTRCSRSSQRWGLPTNLIPQCTPPLPLPKFGSHWKHANMQLLATY